MPDAQFDKRTVEKAIRRFRDLASDLEDSLRQSWTSDLRRFVKFCDADPVIATIVKPLRDNSNVNAQRWYDQTINQPYTGIGSGGCVLPEADNNRSALLFQFLSLVSDRNLELTTFCIKAFRATDLREAHESFDDEIVRALVREIDNGLEDIERSIASEEVVPASHLGVFNVQVHGGIQNSNVAIGGNVSNGNAGSTVAADPVELVRALRARLEEVDQSSRENVRDAISTLTSAIKDHTDYTRGQVDRAIETIAQKSPGFIEQLKSQFAMVVGTGAVLWIKSKLGMTGSDGG